MKVTAIIIFVPGILSVAYGYWGVFSAAGSRMYDEMDGLIPFAVLIIGIVLLIAFIILNIVIRRRRKSSVKTTK